MLVVRNLVYLLSLVALWDVFISCTVDFTVSLNENAPEVGSRTGAGKLGYRPFEFRISFSFVVWFKWNDFASSACTLYVTASLYLACT